MGLFLLAAWLWFAPSLAYAEETPGIQPLRASGKLNGLLPYDALWLDEPGSIEQFLRLVDGSPPDWEAIYGEQGHGHDERLFSVNRERDRRRETREPLPRPLAFLWTGQLSDYDPSYEGFRVAIGPKIIPTSWGLVRFKPDGLPSTLIAIPSLFQRESLRQRVLSGQRVAIDVIMTGRLVPEESIVYDFAHEESGRGMVMPVVRVETMHYLLWETSGRAD
jgi:hypothetical protein